ncbi:MAG: beta-ketoacyl synthase N-terminal-like domain-containing protein [Desulfobacterales bacterium]
MKIYICGIGIISSLGRGIAQTKYALQKGRSGIGPLTLFSTAVNPPLPVGEIPGTIDRGSLPRTHQLACIAAEQAMVKCEHSPDAVVMGVTTGGILTTEMHLQQNDYNPELYRYHGIGSVGEEIARRYRCKGPVITVSTACSSGTAAIKIAIEMLRSGLFKRILAGGADSLCRLTYFGFNSLQLIDPEGARPLDVNRRGMSVAEGAAMLLLDADRSDNTVVEILGAGLSCDAYHCVTPDPQGTGALAAMQAAVDDAGISISAIDYINLHGTGTHDNDLAEADAINRLFPGQKPLLSSIKGAFGHSLAASGAIEAVASAITVSDHLVPANTGCRFPDPDLKLEPVMLPMNAPVDCVLSNSFGFGGNNASVIIGTSDKFDCSTSSAKIKPLSILGCACLTGAGTTKATMANLSTSAACKGKLATRVISEKLSPRTVRRLKRLPRMALSLALSACGDSNNKERPSSVFLGTGWGAQSETYDFLTSLFETDERFPSPTDFVASVHNAAGGQIALQFQSKGPNITTSGGDYSFEQALLSAHLLSADIEENFLLIGVDESHPVVSPLFDRSVSADDILSDGGGSFCLIRKNDPSGLSIRLAFYENTENNPGVISSLIERLGGTEKIRTSYGFAMVGIPGSNRHRGEKQLRTFLSASGFKNPLIDYRKVIGEFASASAVGAVIASKLMEDGKIPPRFSNGRSFQLNGKAALVLGLGKFITAMEVLKR